MHVNDECPISMWRCAAHLTSVHDFLVSCFIKYTSSFITHGILSSQPILLSSPASAFTYMES